MADESGFYCSDRSRVAGDSLAGTAPRVDVWFLLEYSGAWHKKAFEESDLPAETKARFSAFVDALPNSRLLLIRQQRIHSAPWTHTLYVAFAFEQAPTLYRFVLAHLEDALSLDVEAMRRGDPVYRPFVVTDPLYLVCTNGKRDRCCALHGVAAYQVLHETVGEAAWQCTHVGGHRLAANVLCFPHGIYYGRVAPGDVPSLVDAYAARGAVIPDHLRGRSCYNEDVQAAEVFLRAETGITRLDALRWAGMRSGADGGWTVEFEAADGARYRVHGVTDPAGVSVYASCGDAAPTPTAQRRLIGIEVG